MGGTDLGTIAQNIITYMGGAAGGYIAGAALIITAMLWGLGILSGRHVIEAVAAICIAWTGSYIVRTTIGWAELGPLPFHALVMFA